MWKITDLRLWEKWGKYYVYVDGKECTRFDVYRKEEIERQLWSKIEVGNEVDAEKLKQIETFLWKEKYKNSWWREKERIEKVKKILLAHIPELQFEEIGFWVWSEEIIYDHPEKKGGPDLKVIHPKKSFYLEVTGKQRCGRYLWIRPDKIQYYQTEKLEKSWFAHTCDAEDEIFFIQIDPNVEYIWKDIPVNGTMEKMVLFEKDQKWVYGAERFVKGLKKHLEWL